MLLEVNALCKSYNNFNLSNISFALPEGYIMGYIGKNGAGKTTTINLITHLCRAKSGTVVIDGLCYEDNPHAYLEKIGYIGDESFFPPMFRLNDIRQILKISYRSFDEHKFMELVKHYQLPAKKKVMEYSRGMKVKLMFASILARDTKLLILDEATNGLDPAMRDEIIHLLQDYVADGKHSILFSTHMLSDLEQIADYIAFIDNGSIYLNDTKEEILESFIMLKGEEQDLTQEMEAKLIGKRSGQFGFEAIISANDAIFFGSKFITEKTNLDKIMIHHITGGYSHECA